MIQDIIFGAVVLVGLSLILLGIIGSEKDRRARDARIKVLEKRIDQE